MLVISANQYRKGMSEPRMLGEKVSWCSTFWRVDIGFVLIILGDLDGIVFSQSNPKTAIRSPGERLAQL
jgi:hypothetical protein